MTSNEDLLEIYEEYKAKRQTAAAAVPLKRSTPMLSKSGKAKKSRLEVVSRSSDSDSSDSSDTSDSDSSEGQMNRTSSRLQSESESTSESSSSEGDSSDADSSDSSDSSDEEEAQRLAAQRIAKREEERRKKALEAAKAAEAWVNAATTTSSAQKEKKKQPAGPRQSGEAFRRVEADVWNKEILDGLQDNSYEKAFGVDGYGAKASAVLMQVRGKDFRHEKTKKKRGSYRGGEITFASNSFKYLDE